jgi:hypothetical protein
MCLDRALVGRFLPLELTFLPLFEGTRTEGERGVVAKIFMTR